MREHLLPLSLILLFLVSVAFLITSPSGTNVPIPSSGPLRYPKDFLLKIKERVKNQKLETANAKRRREQWNESPSVSKPNDLAVSTKPCYIAAQQSQIIRNLREKYRVLSQTFTLLKEATMELQETLRKTQEDAELMHDCCSGFRKSSHA